MHDPRLALDDGSVTEFAVADGRALGGLTRLVVTAPERLAAARAALEAAGPGAGVLVSLGGDIAVAGVAPAGGWVVQLSEDSGAPIREGAEAVTIASGGLATSSTTVRRWQRGGVELHHILDPRT